MNSTQWVDDVPVLKLLDLCVFGAMLGASAIIGCYFGLCSGRKNSASEYLMGGKSMGILPVSLSLIASHISGITILGVPSEVYRYGTQYWAVIISGFLVSLTIAVVFCPIYTKLQLNSSYQYLELRFNSSVRRMASVIFLIAQLTYIPIVIYVPALAFSQVTGISVHLVTPVTCFVCIFYTTIGGLRAVVWTDALQTVLMLGACIAVMFLGSQKLGGWAEVMKINERGQRLEFFNIDPNPLKRHTLWTVMFGTYFTWLSQCGVMQSMVQRYLSVPNLRSAQWSVFWFSWGLALSKVLSLAAGWLIYASYEGCDPLTTKRVKRPDQLFPLFVMEIAGHIPGFSGLFVAGVFSAALSSMSTGINALSGVLVEDMFSTVLPRIISKEAWLKIAAAFTGVACVMLVFVVEHLGGVLQAAMSLGGITAGAMLGLFLLGMFFPQATSKGALTGSIVSLILVGAVSLGAQSEIASGHLRHQMLPMSTHACAANFTVISRPEVDNSAVFPIFRLSYMYFSSLGTFIVITVGLIASYYFGDRPDEVNPDLYSEFIHRFLPVKTEIKLQHEVKPLVVNSIL